MPRKAKRRVKLTPAVVKDFNTDKKDDAIWDSEVNGFDQPPRSGPLRLLVH